MEHKTMLKTAEEIVAIASEKANTELGFIRLINKEYRKQDESQKWPISGKFNATDAAIRRARRFMRAYGSLSPLEYAYFLEQAISEIVNDCDNW